MKHKKVHSSTSERISNSQSINPSMDFTFNNSKKNIKGVVIRKKSTVAAVKKHEDSITKETQPLKISSVVKVDSIEKSTPNIKRKHKKDQQKAAASGSRSHHQQSGFNDKSVFKEYPLFRVKQHHTTVEPRTGKSVSENVFTNTGNRFSDLPIHKYLVSNLEKNNFTTLTTVQEKAIPVILSGTDSLIRSQTGSGKTLAYAVPIMDGLQGIMPRIQRKDGVQAMVVVPTRELALQTHELFNKINTFQWIVIGHLCGGENRKTEKDRLRKGVHILIGTPGRLLDHILHTSAVKINNVRCLVLDEADRLLDMGFRKDLIRLVEELDKAKSNTYDAMEILRASKSGDVDKETIENVESDVFPLRNITNKRRQTILLSATLTSSVTELANFTMNNQVYIDALDEPSNQCADQLVIPDTVKQEYLVTHAKHRLFTLCALLISKSKQKSKTFVFMANTQMVEFHYELFTNYLIKMPVSRGKGKAENVLILDEDDNRIDSDDEEEVVLNVQFFKLHGNMDQAERKEVFTTFRAAKSGVLLCTDVAARGIDVPEADCIIQYNGPQTNEDYLHRVGRTGRAGKTGSAILFIIPEETAYISILNDHKVFLSEYNINYSMKCLCDIMNETDKEKAAEALQKQFESAVLRSKTLHLSACLAYSSWTRFYHTCPRSMRNIYNFKNINLGHFATSFALRDTPSAIAQVVKTRTGNKEPPRLNKKLANHPQANDDDNNKWKVAKKRSIALATSEYSSGLEPVKKKKRN